MTHRRISKRIAQLVREGYPDGHGQAGAIAYRESRNPPLQHFRALGSNMAELVHGGVMVLYSYSTPVALISDTGLWKTSQQYSTTTSKHIGKWFHHHGHDPKDAGKISQEDISYHAEQGTDPGQTTSHSGGPHEFPPPHRRKNPGKFNDTVEEMLYFMDHDQSMGSVDEHGWFGLVSGLLYPEAEQFIIDNAVTFDFHEFRHDAEDYDWPLNAIIEENDQGFVTVTTYKENREAIREWHRLERELLRLD